MAKKSTKKAFDPMTVAGPVRDVIHRAIKDLSNEDAIEVLDIIGSDVDALINDINDDIDATEDE